MAAVASVVEQTPVMSRSSAQPLHLENRRCPDGTGKNDEKSTQYVCLVFYHAAAAVSTSTLVAPLGIGRRLLHQPPELRYEGLFVEMSGFDVGFYPGR
jgi:hypothetical protein